MSYGFTTLRDLGSTQVAPSSTLQPQAAPVKDRSPQQATLDIGAFAGDGFPASSSLSV